jgi:hypothetical protein
MEKVVDPIAEVVGLVGAAVIAAYRKDGVRRCFRVDYDADELAITLSMLMPAQGRLYSKCIHLFLLDDFCIRAELIAETVAYFAHSKIPDSCE